MIKLIKSSHYRGAAHSTIYVYITRLRTNIYVRYSKNSSGKVTFWNERVWGTMITPKEKKEIKKEIESDSDLL